jgi:hypothetical protein
MAKKKNYLVIGRNLFQAEKGSKISEDDLLDNHANIEALIQSEHIVKWSKKASDALKKEMGS